MNRDIVDDGNFRVGMLLPLSGEAAKYGQEIADNCTILYGGSCNGGNAKELFAKPDVDGGLIGGASLSVEKFMPIIEAFDK